MPITMIVPPHLTADEATEIAEQWPTIFGFDVDELTAATVTAALRSQITADTVREQLARTEMKCSALGAFIAKLLMSLQ
jgi:hypothetical protein